MFVKHELEPIYNHESRILILGSLPSVKSRALKGYYANPQNRFWKIMARLYEEDIKDQKTFCLNHHIALYDVIASCEIKGSSDASISDITINDLTPILLGSKITRIYTTGQKAYQLYQRYCFPKTNIPAIPLPSPSSANARMSLSDLVQAYAVIKE